MEAVCSLFNAHLNVNECYSYLRIEGILFYHTDKVGARGKWS